MTDLSSSAYVQFGADQVPEVNASVRLNARSRMYFHTYPDMAPIVSVDDPPVKVAISVPDPERVTDQDVQTARKLADLLTRYVAELEQLAAAACDTGADPGDPAGRAA